MSNAIAVDGQINFWHRVEIIDDNDPASSFISIHLSSELMCLNPLRNVGHAFAQANRIRHHHPPPVPNISTHLITTPLPTHRPTLTKIPYNGVIPPTCQPRSNRKSRKHLRGYRRQSTSKRRNFNPVKIQKARISAPRCWVLNCNHQGVVSSTHSSGGSEIQ